MATDIRNSGHDSPESTLSKAANVNALLPGVGDGMNALRVGVAALIGGTISELTGGKFANGAATAAMGQAINGNSFWGEVEALGEYAKELLWTPTYKE